MGCGASTPAVEDAGAERDGPLSPAAAAAGRLSASSQPGAPPIGMGRASVSEPNAARAAREEDLSLPTRSVSYDVLGQVQQMQRQLALVNPIPALGLLEAAELLSRRLQAPLVSIVGFTQPDDAKHSDGGGVGPMAANGGAPPPAVLLTAHGRGALVLERSVVMAGPDWSCTRLLERGRYAQESLLDGAVFYFSEDAGEDLPQDWRSLKQDAGLSSFACVLLGPHDAPLGALMVARNERDRLADKEWWQLWLSAVATGLLHVISGWQVAFTTRMLQRLDAVQDSVEFIAMLLQDASAYMLRAANLRMSVRLALVDEADRSKALVFRSRAQDRPRDKSARDKPDSSRALFDRRSGPLPSDPMCPDVVASEMAVGGTLLESSVRMCKARFVRDCASYLQTCMVPARDIFITADEPVAAIVVVPLIVKEVAFGALYFTLESPSDFTNLQETLLGFVASVTLIAHNKLGGHTRVLWGLVSEAAKIQSARLPKLDLPKSLPLGPGAQPTTPTLKRQQQRSRSERSRVPQSADQLLKLIGDDSDGERSSGARVSGLSSVDGTVRERRPSLAEDDQEGTDGDGSTCSADAVHTLGGGSQAQGSSCVLGAVSSKRLATEAMMQVLQSEIQRNQRRNLESSRGLMADLTLERVIGSGGFGAVYRGTWKKTTAAIKVFYARSSEREALKDAVEMAVLSTVNHPNIVQVYACLTDMVEVGDTDSVSYSSGSVAGMVRPRYRKLMAGEEEEANAVCSIVVMEFCDQGTLREAIKRGTFHRAMAGGMLGVDVRSVVEVLLDVAESLHYLHSLKLLHCDVKIENILLKTDPTRGLGFVPKLADFGLVKVLSGDGVYIRNRSGAGTVSYLAPECFEAGSRLTTGVDAYAFGILMYELYTGRRPYEGLTKDAIIQRVHKQHLRPHLPSATPSDYRDLALRCWAHDPAARPTFDEIVLELTRMAEALDADGSVASEQSQGASASAEQQPRQGPGGVQPPQKQLRPDLQQQQLLADQHAAAAMLAARRAPGSRRSTARSGARADA